MGKTTLAKQLFREVQLVDQKLVYRRLGLLPGNWDYYYDYVNRMDYNIVQDRFHLSEAAYGESIRGATRMDRQAIDRIDGDLQDYGSLCLIITAEDDVLEYVYKERGDALYGLPEIEKVNKWFMDFIPPEQGYMNYHVTMDEQGTIAYPADNPDFMKVLLERWSYEMSQV